MLILIVLAGLGAVDATIAGCLVYGSPANGKEVCTKCEDYKAATFIGDLCLDCPAGCIECDVAKRCIRCRESLYLAAATGDCKTCAINCAKCDGPNCGKCSSGHYLDVTKSFCVRCGENCVECQNSTMCSKCLPNYEVAEEKGNKVCKLKLTTSDILILATLGFVVLCCLAICICFCCAACTEKSGQPNDPVIYNNNRNNYQPLTPMQPAPVPVPQPYNPGYNPAYNPGYNANMGYGYGAPGYNQFNANAGY